MNDFPSIDGLVQGNGGATGSSNGQTPKLSVAGEGIEEAFDKKMGQINLKEQEVEAQRLASSSQLSHIDLDKFPVNAAALRTISKDEALKHNVVCFYNAGEEIRLATTNPSNTELEELKYQLEEKFQSKVAIYVVSKNSFDRVISLYDTLPTKHIIRKEVTVSAQDLEKVQASVTDLKSLQDLFTTTETTQLVTFIMGAAFKLGASDLHVEAEEEGIAVRFRMDGIMHDVATLPRDGYKQLVSRIKLLSSLKLNKTSEPQDGRFTIKLDEGDVDVRVSTIPTVYGESIVMRLLRQTKSGIPLTDLGFREGAFNILSDQIHRPNGMIITTGPTGSGKTTTLYSVMHMLNKPEVKILTLEDPVEYKMEGINQSQVDSSGGYTFAKGLRSMLRQDPDIAMVGEIRDLETANIAIQAALTGHLILSTIHTNSAAGAIPRFLSMGATPSLLLASLNCVIGQRLVRKINPDLKRPAELTTEQMDRVKKILDELPDVEKEKIADRPLEFFTAPEQDEQGNLGYKGRVGIYEIFVMNSEIEQLIKTGGNISEYDVEQIAKRHGMVSMVQDGILKAMDGLTSVEEVFRVSE